MREDQARVDAIHRAEVEKARLDAENAARLESLRHQQEHERHITTIKQDKHKRNLMIAAVGAALLLVVGGISAAVVIKGQNDKAAATAAEHARELSEQQAKTEALQRQFDDQNKNIDGLTTQLASATDAVQQAALKQQIEDAKKRAAETRKAIQNARPTGGGGGGGGNKPPRPACTCQSGDPLCSCIQ